MFRSTHQDSTCAFIRQPQAFNNLAQGYPSGRDLPFLATPDFVSVVEFKRCLQEYKIVHRMDVLPPAYELVHPDIIGLMNGFGLAIMPEEALLNSLISLTRPQFASDKVHLLSSIVFDDIAPNSPFQLSWRLQQHFSKFTAYASALDLPVETITHQFLDSFHGGFGQLVAAEIRGRMPVKKSVAVAPATTSTAMPSIASALSSSSGPTSASTPTSPPASSPTDGNDGEDVNDGKHDATDQNKELRNIMQVAREVAVRLESAHSVLAGAREAGYLEGPSAAPMPPSAALGVHWTPPLLPLTPEQRADLRARGVCTRCRCPGHNVFNCPRNQTTRALPAPLQSPPAPASQPPPSAVAPPSTPTARSFAPATTPAPTLVQPSTTVELRRSSRLRDQQQRGQQPLPLRLLLSATHQQPLPPFGSLSSDFHASAVLRSGDTVGVLLDSGAHTAAISRSAAARLNLPVSTNNSTTLELANGSYVKSIGSATVELRLTPDAISFTQLLVQVLEMMSDDTMIIPLSLLRDYVVTSNPPTIRYLGRHPIDIEPECAQYGNRNGDIERKLDAATVPCARAPSLPAAPMTPSPPSPAIAPARPSSSLPCRNVSCTTMSTNDSSAALMNAELDACSEVAVVPPAVPISTFTSTSTPSSYPFKQCATTSFEVFASERMLKHSIRRDQRDAEVREARKRSMRQTICKEGDGMCNFSCLPRANANTFASRRECDLSDPTVASSDPL